jgi:hypothetical protein
MIILYYRTGNKKTPPEMAVTEGAYRGPNVKIKSDNLKK